MGHLEKKEESSEKITSSLGSMLFSIILVALAMGFVFGFKYYLARKTYTGPKVSDYVNDEKAEADTSDKMALEKDRNFQNTYIMVQGLDNKELWASKKPGKKEDSSVSLKEGEILKVKERGTLEGKLYYHLDNDLYVEASKRIIPLKEFVELEGYLSITYISSSGVRLRKWADFDADNIVSSVYVGDKVVVDAKVTTVNDIEAFRTEDGYYITTDSRYLNEHTTVVGEDTAEEKDTAAENNIAKEKDTAAEEDTATENNIAEEKDTTTGRKKDK